MNATSKLLGQHRLAPGALRPSVSPQLARKERPNAAEVVNAFEGFYLGHVLTSDTGDRKKLCNESVQHMMRTLHDGRKNTRRPFTVVVSRMGVNLVDGATNTTAAYVPIKDIACISLNSKHKDSSKAKIVALLARDRSSDNKEGQLAKFVCHVFRLASVEKNWAFYQMLSQLSEDVRKSTLVLTEDHPNRRVGWV